MGIFYREQLRYLLQNVVIGGDGFLHTVTSKCCTVISVVPNKLTEDLTWS